jgi:predicted metalloprotease
MQLGRESSNVEDRRGMRVGFGGMGGGRIGGLGLGGVLVLLALGWLLTGNPLGLLGGDGSVPADPGVSAPLPGGSPTDSGGKFASQVLACCSATPWTRPAA